MEAILLGIYSFIVWLIFFKFKLLPWNTPWKVTVVIIPVVGLATLILLLNVFAPSSADVRVYKYTIPIVSQVRGRVIEVPVTEGNRLVKKGEVLPGVNFPACVVQRNCRREVVEYQIDGTPGRSTSSSRPTSTVPR